MSRLIEKLDEGEHLQPSDDGYIVYWTHRGGYLTAAHLREIADELDRRNKTWHEQVMRDVGPPIPQIKPLVWVQENAVTQTAKSTVGEFSCIEIGKEFLVFRGDRLRSVLSPEAEAKEWCQQEYERRVRECLE